MGLSAGNAIAGVGTNLANSGANTLMTGAGMATNAINQGASSINNAVQGGLGNLMYQQRYNNQLQTMQSIFSPKASVTSGGLSTDLYAG